LAKEKCDDQAGNAKDVCVKEAKAAKEKAIADAKVQKKTGEARADAADAKSDANYKVAREKCDSLAGDAKDNCVAAAKQRYGKWFRAPASGARWASTDRARFPARGGAIRYKEIIMTSKHVLTTKGAAIAAAVFAALALSACSGMTRQ